MTQETKTRLCWWTLIPVGLAVAWIFYAGMKMQLYDNAVVVNMEQDRQLDRHETWLIEMRTMYKQTCEDVKEIKEAIRKRP